MKNFWHITSFTFLKYLLEPMRPFITNLPSKLDEVYCGINRIEEIVQIYEETRENFDEIFRLVYGEVFTLKVQSCKLYNNKYLIASTQVTNTDIFAFIAILFFSYWAVTFCL